MSSALNLGEYLRISVLSNLPALSSLTCRSYLVTNIDYTALPCLSSLILIDVPIYIKFLYLLRSVRNVILKKCFFEKIIVLTSLSKLEIHNSGKREIFISEPYHIDYLKIIDYTQQLLIEKWHTRPKWSCEMTSELSPGYQSVECYPSENDFSDEKK
jgi:Leucine-rich repeat (LRR) protein